jgi:hypothetical protein
MLESVGLRCEVRHLLIALGILIVSLFVAGECRSRTAVGAVKAGLAAGMEEDASRAVLAVGEVSARDRLGNLRWWEVGLLLLLLSRGSRVVKALLRVKLGWHRHPLMTHELRW